MPRLARSYGLTGPTSIRRRSMTGHRFRTNSQRVLAIGLAPDRIGGLTPEWSRRADEFWLRAAHLQALASLYFKSRRKGHDMKARTQIAVNIGLAAGVIVSIEVAQSGNVEQILLQLERDWEQANAKNDTAALERILAPEYVTTDSDGRLTTRAESFARRKSG